MCRRQPGSTLKGMSGFRVGVGLAFGLRKPSSAGFSNLGILTFDSTQISESTMPSATHDSTPAFTPGVPSDDMSHPLTVCSVQQHAASCDVSYGRGGIGTIVRPRSGRHR